MQTSYVRRARSSGGVLSRPGPRHQVVMAKNRGVNDPGAALVERPRALFKGRSRHGSS